VDLADGRRLVLDTALAAELGLVRGKRLYGPEAERAVERGEEGAAKERALHYLKDRDRSRVEVERRLVRYGYKPATIESVVRWLVGVGYLDDRRYAEAFVRSRTRSAWGPRRFTHELLSRGVDKRTAEEAVRSVLAEVEQEADPLDTLVATIGRRFSADLRTDPARARRRIQGYLQRRGYEWDTIKVVLGRVSSEEPR
jgi:regulatory protein